MVSKRLIFAYIWDWIIIAAIAGAGGGINSVTPFKRPFSLLNLDISYPIAYEVISVSTLVVVSFVVPAIIIFITVLLFVPGWTYSRSISRGQLIRLKLWEWEKGWAGLALSVATAFFVTQGLKNLFGKPRPDLLARCLPDLNNFDSHVVGTDFGQVFNDRWALVDSSICLNPDIDMVNDGFRSFPSGHSSFSWSGLLYLSLFLCAKFGIQIPVLPLNTSPVDRHFNALTAATELLPLHNKNQPSQAATGQTTDESTGTIALQDRSAAPPVHCIVVAFIPIAVAFYICSTRYVEFYHFGFDIISGALIGILSSYGAFRWYQLPISRGGGWAWGARSPKHAFWKGVGFSSYVDADSISTDSSRQHVAAGHA